MKTKLQIILITLLHSGLFFLVNYFGNNFNYLDSVFFATGVFFGTVLMYLDEVFLFQYYLEPHDYSNSGSEKLNLITRSLLFVFSLFPLGLFIITSTGSELGIGLFLGIITTLSLELIKYRKDENYFHTRFLFQLKRKLSMKEINFFVAGFSILTLIFILFTFFLGR